jgi:uncharacterized protein
MYKHVDQSWRNQPKRMSRATINAFATQLALYISSNDLNYFSIIFHGGEPLLYGAEELVAAAAMIRSAAPRDCQIDFSLQTNGTLLNQSGLDALRNADIGISLSLDGPQSANDLHRVDHQGGSTFSRARNALELLKQCGEPTFLGVISVIDPAIPAVEIFQFFESYNPPRLDLLLPDATHASPPVGRSQDVHLYKDWLVDAFHVWFHDYSHLKVRWFDAVMATRFGVPSPTDIMGFGGISLIVIDTDGSYTDHDVFKIAGGPSSSRIANVNSTPLADVAKSKQLVSHARLLSYEGLAKECRTCPAVASCSGGCVMHRFHPSRGFDAPTVYCDEMYALLSKASKSIRESLALQHCTLEVVGDHSLTINDTTFVDVCRKWSCSTFRKAKVHRDEWLRNPSVSSPGAHFVSAGVNYNKVQSDPLDLWLGQIRINSQDPLLTAAFLDSIRPIPTSSPQDKRFREQLPQVEMALRTFSESLLSSISELITDIVLVESTSAKESGIFSFSDDKAPNIIYLDPFVDDRPLEPEDIADSILHEFLHHVLYHYDGESPLLFDNIHPTFPAPWRAGLRQSSGFMHGTFVFTWLSRYWNALHAYSPNAVKGKFEKNASLFRSQAIFGVQSLYDMALLTPRGVDFVHSLADILDVTLDQYPNRASLHGIQFG